MARSLRNAHLLIRVGLAIVFLWFGIDKFIHPTYWLNAWVPDAFVSFLARLKLSGTDFIYFGGIFEVLVGVSLVSGFFIKYFSAAAALFLVVVSVTTFGLTHAYSEILVRDIGLVGALLALTLWPERRFL